MVTFNRLCVNRSRGFYLIHPFHNAGEDIGSFDGLYKNFSYHIGNCLSGNINPVTQVLTDKITSAFRDLTGRHFFLAEHL